MKCKNQTCDSEIISGPTTEYTVANGNFCCLECAIESTKQGPRCKNQKCDNIVGDGPNTQYENTNFCSANCSFEYMQDSPRRIAMKVGQMQIEEEEGDRYNEGKSRVDLIPADVLFELGKLYQYGSIKYAPNNWRKGLKYSDTYASLCRHLFAWWAGERDDGENKLHHLTAVIWNAMALLYFEMYPDWYKKFDDRWKSSQPGQFEIKIKAEPYTERSDTDRRQGPELGPLEMEERKPLDCFTLPYHFVVEETDKYYSPKSKVFILATRDVIGQNVGEMVKAHSLWFIRPDKRKNKRRKTNG